MARKICKSVRLTPENIELIEAVAYLGYYNEKKNTVNFSKGLNFILNLFRNHSNFSDTVKYLIYRYRFDKGDRSEEVIKGVTEIESILLRMLDETESV